MDATFRLGPVDGLAHVALDAGSDMSRCGIVGLGAVITHGRPCPRCMEAATADAVNGDDTPEARWVDDLLARNARRGS